jgi:hypothetical protein
MALVTPNMRSFCAGVCFSRFELQKNEFKPLKSLGRPQKSCTVRAYKFRAADS